jgi:carboxyl-terminal processing protease
MQVTSAQYFTPKGNKVHMVGITPDVEAKMPEGDTTLYQLGDMADAQLAKAHEVAKQLIEGK